MICMAERTCSPMGFIQDFLLYHTRNGHKRGSGQEWPGNFCVQVVFLGLSLPSRQDIENQFPYFFTASQMKCSLGFHPSDWENNSFRWIKFQGKSFPSQKYLSPFSKANAFKCRLCFKYWELSLIKRICSTFWENSFLYEQLLFIKAVSIIKAELFLYDCTNV